MNHNHTKKIYSFDSDNSWLQGCKIKQWLTTIPCFAMFRSKATYRGTVYPCTLQAPHSAFFAIRLSTCLSQIIQHLWNLPRAAQTHRTPFIESVMLQSPAWISLWPIAQQCWDVGLHARGLWNVPRTGWMARATYFVKFCKLSNLMILMDMIFIFTQLLHTYIYIYILGLIDGNIYFAMSINCIQITLAIRSVHLERWSTVVPVTLSGLLWWQFWSCWPGWGSW